MAKVPMHKIKRRSRYEVWAKGRTSMHFRLLKNAKAYATKLKKCCTGIVIYDLKQDKPVKF